MAVSAEFSKNIAILVLFGILVFFSVSLYYILLKSIWNRPNKLTEIKIFPYLLIIYIKSFFDKPISVPIPLKSYFFIFVSIRPDSMPIPSLKFTLIWLTLVLFIPMIKNSSKIYLIIFETTIKNVTICKLILTDDFLIIFPFSLVVISIWIFVNPLTVSLPIVNLPLIILLLWKCNLRPSIKCIPFKIPLVFTVRPCIQSSPIFLRKMIITFEVVSIWVFYSTNALDMCLLPIGLDQSSIWEFYSSQAMFFTLLKKSSKNNARWIVISALSTFLPSFPIAWIFITIGIFHDSLTLFQIIFPITLVNITIWISISAPILFTILYGAFKTLSIFEDIWSCYQTVLTPCSKIHITLTI